MRAAVVMFLSYMVVLSGCSDHHGNEVTDIAEIQCLARITIPASARNIHCACKQGIDIMTYGRFDVPSDDLVFVLAGMPADEKVHHFDGHSNVTSHKMSEPWWQPEQLNAPIKAHWSLPEFSVNLLIGESQERGAVTIYFFNFSW